MDDQDIVELYLQRDESAISHTHLKYGMYCHRIAMNTLSVHEDAEECVNDTYYAAWNAIPPHIPNCLRVFLGRITRNLAISRFRSNHAQKRYQGMEVLLSELDDCVPERETVEQIADGRMLSEVIGAWLNTLSEDDRALFIRRYWYGDAVRDLAAEWGIPPEKMTQRMYRLRRRLRKVLEGGQIK